MRASRAMRASTAQACAHMVRTRCGCMLTPVPLRCGHHPPPPPGQPRGDHFGQHVLARGADTNLVILSALFGSPVGHDRLLLSALASAPAPPRHHAHFRCALYAWRQLGGERWVQPDAAAAAPTTWPPSARASCVVSHVALAASAAALALPPGRPGATARHAIVRASQVGHLPRS